MPTVATVIFAFLVAFTDQGPVGQAFPVEDMDTCLAMIPNAEAMTGKTITIKDEKGNDVPALVLDAQLKCVAVIKKEHA